MPDHNSTLIKRTALGQPLIQSAADRGVNIVERDELGLASLHVRKGEGAALIRRIHESFQIELPQKPRRAFAGDVALAGIGPGAWLAIHNDAGNAFSVSLRKTLGDLASVCDQSDGYVVLRVSGRRIREAMTRFVPIDFHPRAFKSGDVAVTVAAHVAVTLWRLDDDADGSEMFEIAVLRSFFESFSRALCESVAALDIL
jgi:heterotetrameric sarcosine oxidase gamma subunit